MSPKASPSAPRAPGAQKLVLLGRFGAAHGLKGEVRLQSFTGDPLAIGGYGPLFDRVGAREFRFESLRLQGEDMLIACVGGVSSRSAAEKLKGVELYAPRENLPPESDDEFYVADLIGLAAETPEGAPLGVVIGVSNFGAGDILEVRPPGQGETLLYPFTKAVVPLVSMERGNVVIVKPVEIEGESEEIKKA